MAVKKLEEVGIKRERNFFYLGVKMTTSGSLSSYLEMIKKKMTWISI